MADRQIPGNRVLAHIRPRAYRRLQAQLEAKLAELDAHMKEVRVRRAMIAGLVEEVRRARGARR